MCSWGCLEVWQRAQAGLLAEEVSIVIVCVFDIKIFEIGTDSKLVLPCNHDNGPKGGTEVAAKRQFAPISTDVWWLE